MRANAPELTAFQSYLDKWLDDSPEARFLRVFLPAARADAYEAHACLEHELLHAASRLRERDPALAKLAWWHEELQLACEGQPRHPVTRRLHAHGALGSARLQAAITLVAAASGIAMTESPPDVDALLAPFAAFARASQVLRLDAESPEDVRRALGAALLVDALRHWTSFAEPQRARLPLSLLARIGTTREELGQGAAGSAVVLDALCAAIEPLLAPIAGDPSAGARVVAATHVVRAIRRDPQACLAHPPAVRSVALLLALWRQARRSA